MPRDPIVYLHLLAVGLLLCVVPFTLFAYGETHISSGLASILNATTPLLTMVMASVFLPAERPTPLTLLGLAVGFGGVLVVLAPWRGVGASSLLGELACLGATTCYGAAFVYLRRFVLPRRLDPVTVALVQVGLAAAILALAAPLRVDRPGAAELARGRGRCWLSASSARGSPTCSTPTSCAGIGATAASTVTYLTPVVGVLLGVVVLGETLSWNEPVGALLVVAGIALGQGLLVRQSTRA